MWRWNSLRQKKHSWKNLIDILTWSQSREASVCRFLLQWHMPNACQLGGSEIQRCLILFWFLLVWNQEVSLSKIQLGEEFPVLLWWFEEGSVLSFTSVLFLYWLALSGSQFAAKVLWCCIQQPVGIHQTQVSHVAAGGVQQLIEDHVCWLGLEKDRGRVDGHRLVGVQSQVAAVRL